MGRPGPNVGSAEKVGSRGARRLEKGTGCKRGRERGRSDELGMGGEYEGEWRFAGAFLKRLISFFS